MLQKLREGHRLSRQQLADDLQLSPGYVLKAEQCVFPSPPAPLIEYWVKRGYDRNLLKSSYFAEQKQNRRGWLTSWEPDLNNLDLAMQEQPARLSGFLVLWVNRFSIDYHPSQYAVSSGLCIPPSAIYFVEKHPAKPYASSILQAVDDLIEYTTSGEYYGDTFDQERASDVVTGLLLMKEVISNDRSNTRVSA